MKRGEPTMNARLTTTSVRPVHDVVMHQRACLKELERRNSSDHLLAISTTCATPTPVGEHGTQSFATDQDRAGGRQNGLEVNTYGSENGPLTFDKIVELLVHPPAQLLDVEGRLTRRVHTLRVASAARPAARCVPTAS